MTTSEIPVADPVEVHIPWFSEEEFINTMEAYRRTPTTTKETIINKSPQENQMEVVKLQGENNVDVPVRVGSNKRAESSIRYFTLPKFSNILQPLLDGDVLSENDHTRLSSILKEELISFLNRENLISSGNGSSLRWEYRNLGETLMMQYPKMLWDLPSQRQKKVRKENSPVYAVFMKRLSRRRKMQRLRKKRELVCWAPGHAMTTSEIPVADPVEVHIPWFSEEEFINTMEVYNNQTTTKETIINKSPHENQMEVVKLQGENNVDVPVRVGLNKRAESSISYFTLPKFSNILQPLLDGEVLSENDHTRLSSILKEELISFLNRENLISNGNRSSLRWEYRNLGETLMMQYPKMLWDLPSQRQKKVRKENSPVYAVFMKRLSQRRKMQRLRKKRELVCWAPGHAMTTSEIPVADPVEVHIPWFSEEEFINTMEVYNNQTTTKETIINKSPHENQMEVVKLQGENNVDVPVRVGSNKRSESSIKYFTLPKFSNILQPLLDGDVLSENDHTRLSSILKEELISFLNRENLISNGNRSSLRWEYRNLGETLMMQYPKMLWDLPSQRQKKVRKENSPVYAVFMKRLSQRRKMQRLRKKRELVCWAPGHAMTTSEIPVADPVEVYLPWFSEEEFINTMEVYMRTPTTKETIINKSPHENQMEVVKLQGENNVDVPVRVGSNKRSESSIRYFTLPKFSNILQPLLDGDVLSENDHTRLSSILKEELISFLNRENLISNGNRSSLRWEYRNLGETLMMQYPKMLWDLPSQRQKKVRKENSPVYAVFMKRLSQRRKMQRLRKNVKEKKIKINQ